MEARWGLSLALLLVAAGCIGAGQEPGPATTNVRPEASGSGAVEGVVTDLTVQPIAGATVSLAELGRNTTTADDGGYALEGLPEGSYTLNVRASGYISATQTVEVQADQPTVADVMLTPLDEASPYMETFEQAGYIAQGLGVWWNISQDVPGGAFGVRQITCGTEGQANCTPGFHLAPELTSLIVEVAWEPSMPTSDQLGVALEVDGDVFGTVNFTDAESPVTFRLDPPELEAVIEGFRSACEDGQDSRCGFSPRETGWPFQVRIWPSTECMTETASVCLSAEQEFRVFAAAFYHELAPEGYTIGQG